MKSKPESSDSLSSAAMRQLIDRRRQFLAFVQSRVESREAAEDILQSAFVRGLEHGGEIHDEESVVAWFYRVLRNATTDHYRRKASTERKKEAWEKEFLGADQPDAATQREICECVMALVDELKPEYAEALRIVDVAEGSLNDLAKHAGITPGNAAVRTHRAREALRKQLRIVCGSCAEHGCVDCRCKTDESSRGEANLR